MDFFFYKGQPLVRVMSFKYLGVTLQTRGTSFTHHIRDKVAAAIVAFHDITNLRSMSLETALRLFKIKITPVIAYGLEAIWSHLTKENLKEIEKVKSLYLKRVLCLSRFTPPNLVYLLARETFYIEDIRVQLMLPSTDAYSALLLERTRKREEVWTDFFSTDAMITTEWKEAGYELRHAVTRFAVHGFHHKICDVKRYHTPDERCKCKWCNGPCDRYHLMWCSKSCGLLAVCSRASRINKYDHYHRLTMHYIGGR